MLLLRSWNVFETWKSVLKQNFQKAKTFLCSLVKKDNLFLIVLCHFPLKRWNRCNKYSRRKRERKNLRKLHSVFFRSKTFASFLTSGITWVFQKCKKTYLANSTCHIWWHLVTFLAAQKDVYRVSIFFYLLPWQFVFYNS